MVTEKYMYQYLYMSSGLERLCFVRFLCNSGCHDSCCPMFSSVNCFVWHCFSFTFWPLSCLSFFDLWLLITPLVSSNFSFFLVTYLDKSKTQNICKGRFIIFKKINKVCTTWTHHLWIQTHQKERLQGFLNWGTTIILHEK
jgi:hypothetical protein